MEIEAKVGINAVDFTEICVVSNYEGSQPLAT